MSENSNQTQTGFTYEAISSNFIQQIREEIRSGYSVSPFVGSGISAASGILMGQEFTDYLAHTVVRVLRDGWDIRMDGWPEKPTRTTHDNNVKFLKKKFGDICEQINLSPRWDDKKHLYGFEDPETGHIVHDPSPGSVRPIAPRLFKPKPSIIASDRQRITTCQLENKLNSLLEPTSHPNLSKTSTAYVEEAAIRNLFDWRATLSFLATATIAPSRRATMEEFDSSVIDSFNRHITVGRKPNLGHKMLAHLSRPLRSRLFLTTNFDDLLEQALAALNMSVETLDVRTGGTLPPPFTVRAQNTILKLHGSLIETRADFTLDAPPKTEDFQRLADIVLGSGKVKQILSHLLVVGYSGYDRRCVLMIKHLLDADKRMKVFWVCFNDWDLKHLETLFHETEYKDRVIVIKTPRPDLLLYEMYQELTFSLPAGGFAYEFTHKVPPQPLYDPDDNHRFHATKAQKELANKIASIIVKKPKRKRSETFTPGDVPRGGVFPAPKRKYNIGMHNPCAPEVNKENPDNDGPREPWFDPSSETSVFVLETESGSLVASRLAFDKLEKEYGKRCLWMEMQDYVTPRHMMDDIFRSLSLWRGVHQIENLVYTKRLSFEKINKGDPNDNQLAQEDQEIDLNDEKKSEWARRECERVAPHYQNLLEYLEFADRKEDDELSTNLVIFMYGRSVPGACSGHLDSAWSSHRSTDRSRDKQEAPKYHAVSDYEQFHLHLEVLSRCGVTVVYMPMSKIRFRSEELKQERIGYLTDELRGQLRGLGMVAQVSDFMDQRLETPKSHCATYFWLIDKFSKVKLASEDVRHAIDRVCAPLLDSKATEPDTSSFYTIVNSLLNDFFSARQRGEKRYATLDEDAPDERYKFLYAVTLFRQSRHVSAFLSEAALRCPHRFQFQQTLPWSDEDRDGGRKPAEGVRELKSEKEQRKSAYENATAIPLDDLGPDNDLARKAVTDLWIRILRKHEVFLYKAGAYCWKFRDIRLALRDVLELRHRVSEHGESKDISTGDPLFWSRFARYSGPADSEPSSSGGDKSHILGTRQRGEMQLDFVGQLRPRTHLWIGGWYFNGFLATGHTNPLIEALYHYLQAIIYSFVACSTASPFDDRDINGNSNLAKGDQEPGESDEDRNRKKKKAQRAYADAVLVTACFDLRKLLRLSIGLLPEFGWGPGDATVKEVLAMADEILRELRDKGLREKAGEAENSDRDEANNDNEVENHDAKILAVLREIDQALAFRTTQSGVRDQQLRFSGESSSVVVKSGRNLLDICATKQISRGDSHNPREASLQITKRVSAATQSLLWELYFEQEKEKISPKLENIRKLEQRRQLEQPREGEGPESFQGLIVSIQLPYDTIDNVLESIPEHGSFPPGVVVPDYLWKFPARTKLIEKAKELQEDFDQFKAPSHDRSPWRLGEILHAIVDGSYDNPDGENSVLNEQFNSSQAVLKECCLSTEISARLSKNEHASPVGIVYAAALAEAAYAYLKRAKMEILSNPKLDWDKPGPRAHLISATVACNLAQRCCKLVPPESLATEIEVRVKILSLYGTALGYLGRYYESHRRLNEAMALLSKSSAGLTGLPLAIIRLRRAEVFLAHSKKIRQRVLDSLPRVESARSDQSKDDADEAQAELATIARQFYSTLDDAVIYLEYAEKTLADVASSSIWWGRYIILLLRAYSVLPSKQDEDRLKAIGIEIAPLLLRKRQQRDATIKTLFRRLVNTTVGDPFRQLRAVHLFVQAMTARLDDGFTVAERDITFKVAHGLMKEIKSQIMPPNDSDFGDGPNLMLAYFYEVERRFGQLKTSIDRKRKKASKSNQE